MKDIFLILILALFTLQCTKSNVEKGNDAFKNKKYEKAIEYYNNSLKEGIKIENFQKNLIDSYIGLGEYFESKHKLKEAEDLYKKAFTLEPDNKTVLTHLKHIYNSLFEYHNRRGIFFEIDKDYINASKEYEEALKYNEENITTLYNYANSLHKIGNLDLAISILENILKISPENSDTLYLISKFYKEKNDEIKHYTYLLKYYLVNFEYDLAISLMKEHLKKFPQDGGTIRDLGITYAKRRNYSEALEYLNKAKLFFPDDIEIKLKIFDIFLYLGNIEEASKIYKDFLEKDLKLYTKIMNGKILFKKGELDKALKEFESGLLNQESSEILVNIGKIYLKKGEIEIASSYFNRALQINFEDSEAYFSLGEIFKQQNKYNDSVLMYKYAVNIDPYYIEAHKELVKLYIGLGMKREAIAECNIILNIKEDDANTLETLGKIYLTSGSYEDAFKYFQKSVELSDSSFEAFKYLAQLYYFFKKDIEKTIYIGEKAYQLNNTSLEILRLLGDSCYRKGEQYRNNHDIILAKEMYKKSIYYYKEALQIDPNDPDLMNQIAWNYAMLEENLNEGIEFSKNSLKIKPNNPMYLDTLAELYYKNKEYNKAVELGEKALKMNPKDFYYKEQLEKFKNAFKEED